MSETLRSFPSKEPQGSKMANSALVGSAFLCAFKIANIIHFASGDARGAAPG